MVLLAVGFAVVGGVSSLLSLPVITVPLGNAAFIALLFSVTTLPTGRVLPSDKFRGCVSLTAWLGIAGCCQTDSVCLAVHLFGLGGWAVSELRALHVRSFLVPRRKKMRFWPMAFLTGRRPSTTFVTHVIAG